MDYDRVYHELLRSCRALAGMADEPRQQFYRHLEGLVAPWLTPEVLARADGEVLSHLLRDCRRVGRELGVHPWAEGVPRGAVAAFKPLAALAVMAAGVAGVLWLWRRAVGPVAGWWDSLWEAIQRRGDTAQMFAIGIAATLLAMYLVARAARS
jgi:hypothetical protein